MEQMRMKKKPTKKEIMRRRSTPEKRTNEREEVYK